jgi:Fur family transcriptional regulator, ferric uptake regulator
LAKAPYKTKQMTELLTYLKSVQGNHITVSDISSYFQKKGIAVGTTTIYRHLEKMVQEGVVAKYVVDGTTSACFEYTGKQDKEKKIVCYHCKCEKCGKLIHLQCNEVEILKQHMMEHHSFEMDPLRTVFYGICSECRKAE